MNLLQINLIAAVVATIVYSWFAVGIVRADRGTNVGVFITLNGMISFLVTFPAAVAIDYFGEKFNFRDNRQMAVAITACAILTFAVVFGAMSLVEYLWALPPTSV